MKRDERPSAPPTPIADAAAASVPVLYVGGCQRSGSTLLDRIMSQVPGHVSAGEVVHLWVRGLSADELCGCGEPFHDCPFWSEVGRVGFGGWENLPSEAVVELQKRVDRNRYIPFMLFPWLSRRYQRDLTRYTSLLERLYRSIAAVGGGVVVDSSKHASTAFLLRRVPSVQVLVIHLIRDSRGVTFSLSKRVPRPEVVEGDAFMHRAAPWRSAVEWMAFNGLFHMLRMTGTPILRARYEELVLDPVRIVRAVLTAEARPGDAADLDFIEGSTISLDVDHTVAGNPMRFEHGRFPLRLDEAWRGSMATRDRRTTTLMTWPLLAAYGYLRRGHR